ncbi:hypothetical protein J2W39_001173 [Variovorax paradoxus]|uniref:Uncharacterized protein n=1 Tax=Variovorax paradoxus TaxID=34073 RepID=A0AAW8EAY1_VARPD|nr:hypothetical protein [Variovorax paradoxus]
MTVVGRFPSGGRDVRPAADLLSFASPKESKQRKGDPTVCVPPLRYGQPAVLDYGGGPQNSLRSNSCGPDPASICAPRRIQKGGEKTGHCFARPQDQTQQPIPIPTAQSQPPRRCAPLGLGGRAKQRPVWFVLPSVCAEERRVSRIRARSCLSEASSARPRETRAPQVARSEAEGRRQWGRLFFAYFLLAKQKKVSPPPGGHPGSGKQTNKGARQ